MKTTLAYLVLLATSIGAVAQKVENDDMYFTAKDRAKLATTPSRVTRIQQLGNEEVAAAPKATDLGINPTDSYSARNVNPEYSTKTTATDSKSGADYFIENYAPAGVNSKLGNRYATNSYYNNNPYAYNNAYGNQCACSPYSSYGMGYGYPMGGFGMGMGSPYGMYGYPGMSMSYGMSFGYGSMMNNPWMSSMYGMGGMYGSPYGYGNPYSMMYDPYMMSMSYPYSFYGYNSYGYNPYSYGGYYGGGYPGTVVVVDNNNGRATTHGRRTDRSADGEYRDNASRQATTTATRTGRTAAAGGRTSAAGQSQPYYERNWRNNTSTTAQTSSSRSHWSNSNSGGTGANNGSSYDPWSHSNSSRSSSVWDNSNSGSGWSGGSSPSRSSWGSGSGSMGGGGGRSMPSGGGGHSRGRD